MLRKFALAAIGALTLGAVAVSAPAPASAQGIGFHFGGGHHGPHVGFGVYPGYRHRAYYPRYRHYAPRRHCERVVVRKRIRGDWRRVVERRCYRSGYRW